MPTSKLSFWILFAFPLVCTSTLGFADPLGSITGLVTNERGEPLEFVAVSLPDLIAGDMTDETGRFAIAHLPAGTYTLKASLLGYGIERREVTVEPGSVSRLVLTLKQTALHLGPVTVSEYRTPPIDPGSSIVKHEIKSEDFERYAADKLEDVVKTKAGVVAMGGELHFRAGRGDEVQVQVDGIPVGDPLNGAPVGGHRVYFGFGRSSGRPGCGVRKCTVRHHQHHDP